MILSAGVILVHGGTNSFGFVKVMKRKIMFLHSTKTKAHETSAPTAFTPSIPTKMKAHQTSTPTTAFTSSVLMKKAHQTTTPTTPFTSSILIQKKAHQRSAPTIAITNTTQQMATSNGCIYTPKKPGLKPG